MIKHCLRSRFSFRTVLILGLFQLVSVFASAQCSLSDYVFTKSTGTFTPISGSTKLPVVVADDASSTAQPIGFQFFYAGRVYDNFYMNSNGYIALVNGVNTASPVTANIRNTANSNTFGSNPILFPLFGDLLAATTTTPAGDAAYILEGTAPNRVLTIQWLNWKWGWSATAPSVSFQAKIYEGTNKIEYVYKPGTVAPNLPVSIGMSAPTAANAASYLSANALSTTATVSGSVFTTTIQPASVVDGLTYTFTPPTLAVTITQQPAAGAVFKTGDSPITITTAATASSALSYQWQQSADNGVTWTNVVNNATFSNATTASMSITNPASTLHKYLYRCQIKAASSSCPNYTSNFTLGIYQGYTVINDLGGVAQSPLNDLRISIGAGGQIQVKRNNQTQVFDYNYADAATTPVNRLFNGVFLTVGTTVFGPSNTPATNATTVTPFVTVSHTGGSMTGDGRDVLVLKATKATKDYIITLTYDYVYPNSYFNIQYKVDVPAGNTDRVKLYHIIDTYLQGGDAGPAFIQGKPPYLLMGVTKAPTFEAFRYVSGLVWTGYYSSDYSGMYSSYLKTQTNFDNILNYVTTTDNGIGWMYDFGASTAAGSYNFSSDLVFELPPLPTVTTQPTNQVGCVNTPVTFSTATSTPNALFSWQVSTNGGTTYTDLSDNGTYSGTATANLVLMPTSAMSTYKYRCIIYTAPGWNAAYTNAATLTVNPVTTAGTPIVSLTTSNFCRNNSYDLTVTNPVNAMTYIWKKDGTIISGAASATYSTTQTGVYSVQFSPSGFCPGASSTPITVVANVICTDTDGDGVNDALDLDDDNDGVLDTTEQYCTTIGALTDLYGPTYWKSIAWTGGAYLAQYSYATPDIYIDGVLNNGVEVFRPGTVANPIAGDDFTATPIIFTLELKNPMHADGFSIVNDYGAAGDNILKADIKLFSGTGSNTILLGIETVDNMADVSSTTRYPFSKGYDNINTIQIVVYKTLPAGTQAANGMQMGELGLYSNPGTFCNDLDTDGDGIPNRLDLDSDGDGCPDALESGIPTAILTSGTVVNLAGSSLASGTISSTLNNAVVSTVGTALATFGNNGYANAVETASESGIYSGTYTYQYAKWKSYASCLDTDGDGIPDITDIDDDNDGILDAVESPNCFSSITDAVYIGAITSNLTQYSTYAIGQSIDQNASTASAFSTGQNWVGQEIFRMTPAVNGALKISGIQFDLLNWGLSSATTSTFKLQGSNNAGSSWTDLSVATYSTATTGTFTINNTLQTATAYSLYRLVGVAGTSGYGGVTEIRLMPTSDYVPSMHQIYTCTLLDTDGDGIPNTIDLDSDGDGCPDAKETGIIGTLTAGTISNMVNGVVVRNNNIANTIATGAYGANGFANALETGSETGIYTSTYYYDYAITATLNACADSDGDGVSDLIDLDNDNDGILNAVESPTCYYSLSELATPNDVSSDLTPYSSYAIGQSIDGSATTASGFATGQNWVDKEIFKFTADTYIAITGMSLDLINWALSSATASTFKLQGSTDNMYWKDLSAAVYSTATSGTFTIANTLSSTTKFKYFRLVGVAGTSGYGGVSEARFNLIASTNASANPKNICNNDTDGDGIFNQNDLDSDGDSCPDAIEAGTAVVGTTAFGSNSFFNPATTGANGFANSLETATESGIYSGTYKYIRALSSAISACLDTDGDGVPNIDDIDDDNDGVLDIAEMNCTPVVTNATCLATPQAFGITTHCSGWNGFDYDPSPTGTIISNFDYMGLTSGIPYFDFQGSTASSATTVLIGKMYKNYTTIPGMTYTFSVNLMSSFVDAEGIKPYLKGVDGTTGYELGATYLNGSGVRSVTFTAIGTTTTISLGLDTRTSLSYTGPNQFWYEAGFTMNGATYQTCTIADTDNDGIPNYLDVDSDGDGCPDAVEAQTTYVSTSGVASSAKLTTSIIPGPYGTNGFANGLETVTDNGIYTSTYTYNYATDATINACTDTDGDGIPDAIDLDDDNDGILDTIEENCTVSITSKSGLIITKPSTINYTFNSNTIANLIDGVDNNVYVTSAPTGTLSNSPWFNFQFPTPKTLTYLEIGHYTNQYLFATTSTYKIQGSNDNSTWNDVTGTLTYNNIATSTSGGLSTNNSNIANFPSNRTAYTYYRIYGLAATAGAGWATEIYFKETNCFTDVDGDGIPNKLDTDSDGDGCPDAVEAGTTYISTSGITGTARVTASTIPAPYGANGFANGLETTSESGIYTGSYTYGYALDATINACTDTDGDGVPDILDLDDDNDGVLDTVECPASAPYTLYTYNYPATTIASNVPVNITGMSSQDVLLDQRTNGVAPNAFTYNSITNWKLVASNIKPSAANTITVKIAPTASTTATYVFADAMLITNGVNTYVIDNNATNTGGFNLTGTWTQQTGGYANTNSYLTSPSYAGNTATWTFSNIPVPAICDTDGDGIPNRLDTDSDGDGCPDAVESGATAISTSGVTGTARLTTSVIPAPYGANGFANGLETTTESGLYTGTYTYNYALDATINACTDTDGDGVPDIIDLDDDNDGVLDFDENYPQCAAATTFNWVNWTSIQPYSATGTVTSGSKTINVTVTHSGGGLLQTTGVFSGTLIPSTFNVPISSNTIANQYAGDIVVSFSEPVGFPVFAFTSVGQSGVSVPVNTTIPYKIEWVGNSVVYNTSTRFTGTEGNLIISLPTMSNSFKLNYSASEYYCNIVFGIKDITKCAGQPLDTDGDGLINSMDLDSDGDGCPDAVEAGTTYISTSGVSSSAKLTTSIIPAPYGANGFANGLETANESGLYTGTYTYNYALDATLNACTDTDGDGVPDIIDLDDDNDGILDTEECDMRPKRILFAGSTEDFSTMRSSLFAEFNNNKAAGATIVQSNIIETATVPAGFYDGYDMVIFGGAAFNTINANHWTALKTAIQNKTSKSFIIEADNCCVVANQTGLVNLLNGVFGTSYALSTAHPATDETYLLNNNSSYASIFTTSSLSGNNYFPILNVATSDILFNSPSTVGGALAGMKQLPGNTSKNQFVAWFVDGTITQGAPWYTTNQNKIAPAFYEVYRRSIPVLNCDTDNDGIPNHLDLDSDGDGCPDAKESGVTGTLTSGSVKNGTGGAVTSTTTVANAIAAGPYGANGLANGVETATESGVVTYTSTYSQFALVADVVSPNVSVQPLNKTVFVGSSVVLTTTAGTPPANRTITYQWYKAGVAIAGATSATYTVTSSATTSNADNYYCQLGFVNSCLTTNTNTVNVTVLSNPVGLTACQDANAILTVTKTGTNTVTYQWKKVTTSLVNGTNVSGATTATLALSNLTLADAGAYYLYATDGYGNTINSLAGTITITNNTKYSIASSTTTCATNNTINITGGVVSGTSGATSTKWQRSLDGGATWVDVVASMDGVTYANFTTGTLGITAASTSASAALNGYQYRIATSNATCTNYSNISTLNIGAAPTITAQPSNSVLCNSFSTSFTAAATGANLTYQWQTRPAGNGAWVNITAANANTIDAGVVYANYATATLNLSAAPSSENNNQYQVVFSNSCGTVTSTTAILNPTVVTPTLTGANVSVCSGTPVTLTASSSTASPTYQWYLGGTAIGGATNATFNPTASGSYSVIANATGYCSSATASGTVTINPPPTVTIAQGAVLSLSSGGSIQLTANALPTGTYSYIWYNNGVAISGQTASTLNVAATGSYTVKATNTITNCFATSASTVISSLPAPSVNGSTTICTGGSVGISFSLPTGQTIQWETSNDGINWIPAAGATSATLNASPSNSTNTQLVIYYHAVISAGTNGVDPTGTSNAIAVTVNPLPTATIASSNSSAVCVGTAITLTATTNASNPVYTWFNNGNIISGANANTYSTTNSGIYNFNVTDGITSCSAGSATSTVIVASPPTAPNLTATAATICLNASADLTLYQPQAVSGVVYEWHTVSSNPSGANLVANSSAVSTAGTYYLFAKNATAGCYSAASVGFTLSVTSVATANLTSASNPTYLLNDFATALNAATTNPTFALRWYAAATGGVALTNPVLPSTTSAGITNYYVEQYDPSSYCASLSRVQAVVTVKPLAPTVSNIAYCQNASATALTATAAIGSIINWYTVATGGSASNIAITPSTSSTGNTNYYVSQTVNGVESDRALISVIVNPATATPSSVSGNTTVISLSNETYSVTNVANTTYQWTLPSFMSGSAMTNSITATINTAGTGFVSVIATNTTGCPSLPSTTPVQVQSTAYVAPAPTASNATYTTGDPNIPANTSGLISGANGSTINYYSNPSGAGGASQSIPSTPGSYTFYVSQTINGVESALVPYTITIKPLQPTIAPITYCQNDVAVALTATGSSLKWYTTASGGTATTTAPTPSTSNATNTTYYVSQTIGGVESDRIALLVTVNPTPTTPSSITGATTVLASTIEQYSVTNDITATSFNWILPNGWSGSSTTNSISASVGSSAGQIIVTAITGACTSPVSILTVAIAGVTNPPVTSNITFVTGSVPSNIASITAALITPANGATLNYYISNASGTASTTSQATPTTPGVYTYYVSQTIVTGGLAVESILVPYTVTIKPTAPAINTNIGINGNAIVYCKNVTSIALTATPSTGASLIWYAVPTGGSGANTAPIPSTSLVGSTSYYVSQIVNGVESDRSQIIVTVNDLPGTVLATANTQPTCSITSGSILVASPLGTGFTYSADGITYTSTTLFNALPPGTYYITAQNTAGCISAPTTVVINTAPLPPLAPTTIKAQPTCASITGSITVNVVNSSNQYSIDGGLSYQASNVFNNVAAGSYSVTVKNADGCISSASAAVINAAPLVPTQPNIISSANGSICAGTSVTLTSSASIGNQWFKDGVLISGAINQTFVPTSSGNYTVVVTNASGCSSPVSPVQNITFNPIPVPSISEGATLAFNNCSTTTITLSANNSVTASGNSYQWFLNGNTINVNATGATYNVTQAGNYSVAITNNGCTATSAISKVIAAPSLNAANTAFCAGSNTAISISGMNTGFINPTYQWQISTDGGTTYNNAPGASTTSLTYIANIAGKYQLVVTDGVVNSTSCPIAVTQYPTPMVTIISPAPNTAYCAGTSVVFTSVANSGTASYTYQWLNGTSIIAGAISNTYTTGIAGSYGIQVTDANGCQVNAVPVNISIQSIPSAPAFVVTNPTCSVTTGTISVTTPLGTGYSYSIDGINYTNTTGLFTGVLSGNYSVTVKSAAGCSSLASTATVAAALVVPTQPTAIIGAVNVVANSLNTYSVAPVSGATSYTWSVPGYWSGVSTTNSITIKVDGSDGIISVVANSATCSGPAQTLNIVVSNTTPDINVTDMNVPVSGNLSTNDLIPVGTTYGQPATNPANPAGGTIIVNSNGTYTFTGTTPGKYVYYVPVCALGQSTGCPLSAVEITVLAPIPPTDKPVANNDAATTSKATPVTVNILANDAAGNPGGTINPTSVTIASNPAHGTVIVNSDGTLIYTPASNFIGSDSAVYRVCDNSTPTPLCQTAVVYFTVNAPAAPAATTAVDDYATVTGSANGTVSVSGNVLTNDSNTAGGTLTATVLTAPLSSQGVFTMNANGTYTFTPAPGFSGPVDIVYQACSATGVCEKATLHILVDPAPIVAPDFTSTSINVPVNGSLATNDVVPAGTTYGQLANNPNNPVGGTITVNPDGTYTFTGTTPGKYTYYVPVCAPGQTSNCPLSPIEITVVDPLAANNKPIANNDIATTAINTATTVNILANDKAGNIGGTLNPSSVTVAVQPAHGTVVVNNNGTITYTPTTGFVGTDSVIYSVCDNSTPTPICQTAVTYFTVKPNTASPTTTAADDFATVVASATGTAPVALTGNVISNDKNTAGAGLTASVVSGPTAAQGTFTMNANGIYTFTPTAGFSGTVDITYTACTGATPPVCSTATLHILVEPAPVMNPDVNVTDINVPVSGNLAANDKLPAGTTYGQPANNPSNPSGASMVVNPNGTYTFTATTPGKYVYYVPVCAIGQTTGCPLSPIEITVLDPNTPIDIPATNNDIANTTANTPVTVNVLANDKAGNVGGALNFASEAITVAPTHGTAVINSDGTISYTPANGFVGKDSVTYTVCDNTSPTPLCNTAVVYFTVNPVIAPAMTTANEDAAIVLAGRTAVGNVLSNDINSAGNTLTASLVNGPSPSQGTMVLNADGSYSFTPSPGFSGPVDITYKACDGSTPPVCAIATLHILVETNPILTTVLTPDVNATNINVPVTGSLSSNDQLVPGATYGQPAPNPANPAGGVITVSPNGTYTFTGTTPGTYTYYVPVCAANQTTGCPLSPIQITVLDPLANTNAPVANTDIATLPSGSATTVKVLANDKVGNLGGVLNPSSVTVATQPANGTVTVNVDGSITYTPTAGFVGIDSVIYNVCDNSTPPICKNAVVYFTVTAANTPSSTTAADDYVTLAANANGTAVVRGNVLTNDKNTANAALTASVTSGPTAAQGLFTMNANGVYTFTPTSGFSGPIDIIYTVCSPLGDCATATLHILISPAPVLVNDAANAFVNIPSSGNISTNDVVPSGTTYGQPAQLAGATITIGANGTYTFTVTTAGTYTYTVPVCSPGQTLNCPTETLVITVPVNTLVNDAATAFVNIPSTGNISTNDLVPSGTTYGQPAQLTGATITVAANGTYTITATTAGTYTYTVPVCAPGQTMNCPTETLVITVPVNTLVNDTASTLINIPKAGNIATNDIVPTGTTYGQPAPLTGATITIGANGTYTFTATAAGTYTYTVPVCAPGQITNCPTEILVIIVTNPTPPPPPVIIGYIITPDFSVTNTAVPLSGNLNTNDNVPSGTTYGQPAVNPSNPSGATLLVNPNGTYTFNATKPGMYTYYVPVCAAGQTTGCSLVPLVITVVDPLSNTNPPIVNPDIATTIVNTPVTTNILANDKAANVGASLNPASVSIATAPKNGTVIVNTDGTITYTPTNGFVGTDSLVYNVCDNSSPTPICKTGVVYYTVKTATVAPASIAADDFAKTIPGISIAGNVLANDKNTAGALLTVTSNSSVPASKGVFVMNNNGDYTFTPAPGFTGPIDIVYTVCGGTPAVCTNATLHILVEPVIPTKILDVVKVANSAKMNLDGSFNIDFVIKVKNLTADYIDSILVKDDITKVFKDTRGVSVVSVIVSGKLIKNNSYNGISNTDLLIIQSALDAKKEDSIILTINVQSNQSGNFANTAVVSAPTNYGFVNLSSTDPTIIIATGDTTRKPSSFVIPLVDIIIPGGFSPNNDGIDDVWVIKRPFGTTISVKVFNRWGNEVYSNANYLNDWRGKGISNFIGEDVPEGTYFYVVESTDVNNVTRKFAASLTLVR